MNGINRFDFGDGHIRLGWSLNRSARIRRIVRRVGFRLTDGTDRRRVGNNVGSRRGGIADRQRDRHRRPSTRGQRAHGPSTVRSGRRGECAVAHVDIDNRHAARQRQVFGQ